MTNISDVLYTDKDLGKNLYRKKTYYTLVVEQDVLAKNKDEADQKFLDYGGIKHSAINKDIVDASDGVETYMVDADYTETHPTKYLGKVVYEDDEFAKELISKLPLKAIESEFKDNGMVYDRIENETIPHEIYSQSPISYVATSFPNIKNYVFLNMGVFNPIYYYHPLLFLSNEHTLFYFKKHGYKTFDFLFDERYDKYEDVHDRMLLTFNETEKINKLNKNQILDIIWDNQDILKHNRNHLIQNNSIISFIDKLNSHVLSEYKNPL